VFRIPCFYVAPKEVVGRGGGGQATWVRNIWGCWKFENLLVRRTALPYWPLFEARRYIIYFRILLKLQFIDERQLFVVMKSLLVENCTKLLKMVDMLFEGMRKHRIEDPFTCSTLGISISSQCCLIKLLLADWMWQRCAYTLWCLGVLPEDDPYGKSTWKKFGVVHLPCGCLTCTSLFLANCTITFVAVTCFGWKPQPS